jgi:hypothetical protein
MPKYNGHANWNAWNVYLWIGNDAGLYSLARDLCKRNSRHEAARAFVTTTSENGSTRTPDGAPWTVTNVRRAMRNL